MTYRSRITLAATLTFTLAFTGCRKQPEKNANEPGYHRLQPAPDLDPAEDVLEVSLTAARAPVEILAGVESQAHLYEGSFPGPLLEAKLGDTVKVHFRNELTAATTVHWHGLRVPSDMDGTTLMMNPVEGNGGTFEYQFDLRDTGLYWYHPHMSTDVAMERGLYGVILVRDPSEPKALRELPEDVLVLDDISIDEDDGTIDIPGGMDSVDGLEGSLMLVNGRPDAVLPMRAGEIRRWRLLNAASARYFLLELEGHLFRVIGTDGGLVPEPYETEQLLLTPGDRFDVLVFGVGEPGSEVELVAKRYDRGQMHGVSGDRVVATLRYSTAAALEDKTYPETARPIASIVGSLDTVPVRDMILDEGDGFMINGELWPDVTPVTVEMDAVEIWRVDNRTDWDHPFHLHGNFFQPLTLDGVPLPLEWQDTINVKRHTVTDIAIRHDNPGGWMYHCHILGHAEDLGMAGELIVGDMDM